MLRFLISLSPLSLSLFFLGLLCQGHGEFSWWSECHYKNTGQVIHGLQVSQPLRQTYTGVTLVLRNRGALNDSLWMVSQSSLLPVLHQPRQLLSLSRQSRLQGTGISKLRSCPFWNMTKIKVLKPRKCTMGTLI